jgi:hypothetical protein
MINGGIYMVVCTGGREALLQSFEEGQTFPVESLADVTSLDDGDIRYEGM